MEKLPLYISTGFYAWSYQEAHISWNKKDVCFYKNNAVLFVKYFFQHTNMFSYINTHLYSTTKPKEDNNIKICTKHHVHGNMIYPQWIFRPCFWEKGEMYLSSLRNKETNSANFIKCLPFKLAWHWKSKNVLEKTEFLLVCG